MTPCQHTFFFVPHGCGMQVFAKCGVIKEDDERRPRVKVYRDRESSMPKGDGLVTYLKDPSVCLHLHLLREVRGWPICSARLHSSVLCGQVLTRPG